MKFIIKDPLGKNRKLVIALFSAIGLFTILALTPKSESVEDLFNKATQSFNEAMGHFDSAIMYNPDYAEAYQNRGLAKSNMGIVYTALDDFAKAIELKPEFSEAYNNRGKLFYRTGSFYGAQLDFDKAIEINPESYTAYFNRGVVRIKMGEKEEGRTDLRKSKELKQKSEI